MKVTALVLATLFFLSHAHCVLPFFYVVPNKVQSALVLDSMEVYRYVLCTAVLLTSKSMMNSWPLF